MEEADGNSNIKNDHYYVTTDLAFAAFLRMHNFKLSKIDKFSAKRFTFIFLDPKEEAEDYSYQFLDSESKRFDDAIKSLKALCFTKDQNKPVHNQ